MLQLILRRLIQLPLILITVFLITFTLVWLMPGDPTQSPDQGKRPSEAVQMQMKKRYNLDSPSSFLVNYAERVVFHGDLGPSIKYPTQTVSGIVKRSLPISATLGLTSLAFALLLGTFTGIVGAWREGSLLDTSTLSLTLLGISLPSFVTASIFLALGDIVTRQWIPNATFLHLPLGGWEGTRSILLPALALSLPPAAYIARLTRLGLADVMKSDFIRTARAKGLSESAVISKHAIKVAFLPVLSFLGPAAASAMTGSFVIEKIFNIPGMGHHFITAVQNKDQFIILGVVLVFASLLVFFNLLVDLAYAWIDPRIDLNAS